MITITIPKNDYVKPNEPRQEVVQRMVDILIRRTNRGDEPEFCANRCWRKTWAIGRYDGVDNFMHHSHSSVGYTDIVQPTTCEMKALFKVWIEAGYYISRGTYTVRSTAILYKFTKKPYTDYGYRVVTEFMEDID